MVQPQGLAKNFVLFHRSYHAIGCSKERGVFQGFNVNALIGIAYAGVFQIYLLAKSVYYSSLTGDTNSMS